METMMALVNLAGVGILLLVKIYRYLGLPTMVATQII
jgi:hypothetical protein